MPEPLTLAVRTREDFRKSLAGLIDPDRRMTPGDQAAFRPKACRLVVCLCLHFGRDLDRKTLWSRIDSAIQTTCAKVSDGDTDRWLDLMLDHVRANPAMAAACPELTGLRADLLAADPAHNMAFIRWVESRRYAVLSFGRAAWDDHKKINAAAAEGGGDE